MNLEVPLSASLPLFKTLSRINTFKTLCVAAVFVLVTSLCVVVTPKAIAQEQCSGSYTDLKWKDGSRGVNGDVYNGKSDQAQVEFKWSVGSSVKPGEQFKITLPPQLTTVFTGTLDLQDSNGAVVATTNILSGQKEVVFTLTEFVTTHFNVNGSAFLLWSGIATSPD